jgi:hypothetical protein
MTSAYSTDIGDIVTGLVLAKYKAHPNPEVRNVAVYIETEWFVPRVKYWRGGDAHNHACHNNPLEATNRVINVDVTNHQRIADLDLAQRNLNTVIPRILIAKALRAFMNSMIKSI